MSESLRRSTRTIVPVTPFTIENPPTLKRKRPEQVEKPPVVMVKSTVEPPVKNQREHLSQCFPPTMFSDRSLDNVLQHNVSLQKDLEELRGKGTNITVKELLAKNFKHYRVRPSQTSERATEIVNRTLSENEVPRGALFSGPPLIPPTVNIGNFYQERKEVRNEFPSETKPPTLLAALEGLVKNVEIKTEIKTEIDTESGLDDFAAQMLATFTNSESTTLEPIAYPGNFLPWPVFWKSTPNSMQGEIYLYVGEVVYTPISDIMKAGQFLVPLNRSIPFVFNEKLVEVTLQDMLMANGVNLTKAQHYRMLQGVLHRAGVHIRADFAERLHEDGRPRPPLVVSMESLPLVCKNPELFVTALGKKIHGAVLVDTSGEKPQIANQTYASTVYSEQLEFDARRQILILHDADVSISQIAHRYQCSIRSVHETIGTRLLIERHQIDEYLREEEPEVLHSNYTTGATVGDVMRPRNKIRRTHYVDLNKLVWKHFKDCQAQGVQINGKHLKDQAMRYAKEMGLESFRGSEGWLDAFKRRHKIDLKTMTGFPVCYENDMLDEVEGECEMAPFAPQDDITSNFFSSLLPEPSSSNHLQNMLNSMMPLPSTLPPIGASFPELEQSAPGPDTFYNVMKSCQIRVADKEVSLALDTIRTYILAHDPPAMNLLVPLQERLARTSATIASAVKTETPTTSS